MSAACSLSTFWGISFLKASSWRLNHGTRTIWRTHRNWGYSFPMTFLALNSVSIATEITGCSCSITQRVLNSPALRDCCFREQLLKNLILQLPGHRNTSAFACKETEGSSPCWQTSLSGVWCGAGFRSKAAWQAQMPWNHDIDLQIMRFRK